MAITEEWLQNKGAIRVCGGDWEIVYSLGTFFYEVDRTFKTVNRIIPHRYHGAWLHIYHKMTAPHHLVCRRTMFPANVANGSQTMWECDHCWKVIPLEVVGGAF
jgi:hypothetical protein